MINCFKNYGGFGLCGEKRLLFEKPKEKPPTPEELLASIVASRKKLQEQIASQGSKPASAPSYHTDRRDTRELVEPPKTYTESTAEAMKGLRLREYLEEDEVKNIQGIHQKLYQQYMNPAFMLYLQKTGKFDRVYPALNLVMRHPYDFEYQHRDQKVEIVKRKPPRPLKQGEEQFTIPDNFSVLMETSAGYVTRVNGENLKQEGSEDIPWMSGKEYNTRMENYYEEWNNLWTKRLYGERYKKWVENGQQPPDEWEKIFLDSFTGMPEELKTIHVLNNIEFPKQLVSLVRSRNLGWEEDDPRFKLFKEAQKDQGTNYEQITTGGYGENGKRRILVFKDSDPANPGGYYIMMRTSPDPLRVSPEGYMMVDRGEGQTPRLTIDPRYPQAIRRQYYKDHPGAPKPADLSKTEADIEAVQKDLKKVEEARRKAEEDRKNLVEAQKKRPDIDKALDEAVKKKDIAKLKEVAKAIPVDSSTNALRQNAIEAEKDIKRLRTGIKGFLDGDTDGSSHKRAAELLGVK